MGYIIWRFVMFVMTWGWVNDIIYLLEWAVPLRANFLIFYIFHFFSLHYHCVLAKSAWITTEPVIYIVHIRFQGGKKDELIGITYNRMIRMDASTGDAIKTWRFSNMKQWNVNWEIKMVRCLFVVGGGLTGYVVMNEAPC